MRSTRRTGTSEALLLFIFGNPEVDMKSDRSKIDEATVSSTTDSKFNVRERELGGA